MLTLFIHVTTMDVYVQLVNAYAQHLVDLIPKVRERLCYGCQFNRPSQIDHDVCVMMSENEQIMHCLPHALKEVEVAEVLRSFANRLDVALLLRCPERMFKKWFQLYLHENEFFLEDVKKRIVYLTHPQKEESEW